MRKKTRDELNRLRQDVNDLNVMVYAIAQAAGVVPIRVPEQKPSTKWVHKDSDEWKAEVERRQHEQGRNADLLKTIYPTSGHYPGEWIWP